MPSSRPSGPKPSLVVAFTPTASGAMPIADAIRLLISAMCGLSLGRSAITTASIFTTDQPRSFTSFTT